MTVLISATLCLVFWNCLTHISRPYNISSIDPKFNINSALLSQTYEPTLPTNFPQFGLMSLTLMSLGDWSLKCFFLRLILVLNSGYKIMSFDDLSEIIKDFLVDCRCRFYTFVTLGASVGLDCANW